MRTMDATHDMIERNILKQTVRFDKFFGTVKPEILRDTKYALRWRSSIRVEEDGTINLGTTLRAYFTLSRISQRLRLFVSREDEPGLTTPTLPEDPGTPGLDRTTPAAHFTSTELRYELIQKPNLHLFLGAGFRLKLPFEAFARSRVQYTRKLSDIALMRVTETFFVKSNDFIGETTEFSLERLFGKATLLRWASTGTASEEIEGLEWGSELSLSRQLSPKDAIALTGGVYGNTSNAAQVGNYRIFMLYRQNFLRSWLFYELEPQVSWPRSSNGSNPATFAFTFRIEIGFQGTTATK